MHFMATRHKMLSRKAKIALQQKQQADALFLQQKGEHKAIHYPTKSKKTRVAIIKIFFSSKMSCTIMHDIKLSDL